jgi:predicted amidophosphoribosyltransferase
MADFVCAECREEIDREATTCPHCGHEGAEVSAAYGVAQFLVGGVLTATIIGAIIGIPLMRRGMRRAKRAGESSPGVEV